MFRTLACRLVPMMSFRRAASTTANRKVVTLVPGDGVGPEITGAVVDVFAAANIPVDWDRQMITGEAATPPPGALESMQRTGVVLKGPLYTPVADGHYSTASTIRKQLDLYADVILAKSVPGITTRHGDLDLVVVRENMEGEYSGLEHEIVPGVVESLKIITRKQSELIAKFAFDYAVNNDRRKVTAVHKANIMKLADGLFIESCRKIAQNYPDIKYEEVIIDACCMQLVSNPRKFDVMVMPNLYGTIVGNVAAGLIGGPGVVAGINYGPKIAVFEQGVRHLAFDIVGKDLVNPTATLLASVKMLKHLQLEADAERINNALTSVIQEGKVLTRDVGGNATTSEFVQAVISRLK
eukprot:TRINITY_DN5528_c0_g1_i1.p1 TRINITY_DN5528_c0_g1~~TRINITY_DN5528_c0_g1_i1.p1  ORF type:complete len:353 (-),score=96.17 TRINITY_DN5528_c0_g1_i1:17-1075(-)